MTYGIGKPSQAEGDRETIDADLRQRGLSAGSEDDAPARAPRAGAAAGEADQLYSIERPSQAEGDRETVEESLRQHER